MTLFNEINSLYYKIINDLLMHSHEETITKATILDTINKHGFLETNIHLAPMLLDPTSSNYVPLFQENNKSYTSILNNPVVNPVTTLELRWLKSMLEDPRINLFLDDTLLQSFNKSLTNIQPLYPQNVVQNIRIANDGDPYTAKSYQTLFKQILHCTRHNICLTVTYYNKNGYRRKSTVAPYKIEYSNKNDKFRLSCVNYNKGHLSLVSKLNFARIISVTPKPELTYPDNILDYIEVTRLKEPIVIELKDYRNGFDRCFHELSNYERESEFDEEQNLARIKIYYYPDDEPELLIKLMSYGPILKVISPSSFKEKFVARIKKQHTLFE